MAPCERGRKATETIVLLSGGIDSATCVYLAKKRGDSVRALTLRIDGTAEGELAAARSIAKRAGVLEHRLVGTTGLKEAGDITKGPLARGAVPSTYIPMKNAVFYSMAAAFADESGADVIMGGHNKDDAAVFQDTSDPFFADLQRAFRVGSPRLATLKIERPLRRRTKSEVVLLANRLGVPLELTWSCHRGGREQCLSCDGCRARAAAFRAAGLEDPLVSARALRRLQSSKKV